MFGSANGRNPVMEVDVLFLPQLDYSIMSSDNLDASETSFGK